MGIRLRRRAPLVVAVLVVLLGGCGDGDDGNKVDSADKRKPEPNGVAEMSPPQVLRAALKANRTVKDLTYTGKLLYYFPIGNRAFEARITATEHDCEMVLTSDTMGKLTSRIVKDTIYHRGSETAMAEVLEYPVSDVALIGRRWLSRPLGDRLACTRVGIVTDEVGIDTCQQGGEGEIDGTPTVTVRCMRGAVEMRIHVAATGKPLIIRMEDTAVSGDILTLVDVDSGVRIATPPKRDVIDTTALE
jgi:hypothetical protein